MSNVKGQRSYRVAILTSHPIQYQAPLFKKINEHPEIDLTVYFQKKKGATAPYYDKEFGKKIQWEIPLLEGYEFKFLSSPLRLRKEFQPNSYDAVMLYGWNSWINIYVFMVCRMRGIKIFMYGENPLSQEIKKHGFPQKIKRILLRFLFRRISAFLYIGEENKKFYKSLGVSEKKLFYTPYAVDNKRWQKSVRTRQNDQHEFTSLPVVLFVGKLVYKKRPLDLIRAFAPLQERANLIMVGEGELRPRIESYVRKHKIKNLEFAGFVNQGDLSQCYSKADVFILPSDMGETWGLVVNEAMNFSLPVIVSDMAGCARDLVRHGRNGYVYPCGDIQKLQEYLRKLIKNRELREKFGKKSLDIIQAYSYEADVRGLVQALREKI